ncbi:hypothetical protein IFM89_022415 [Coptis chinensis]|uniref:Pectinesterase inhibitor domain-containing protein n=1 Tax=Coptis chinensis TaxID=261450 RepID=A0A835M4I5_9MAGN|nr:hypothetical protein IFM89_022415 [Coptis chinensis]
MLSSSVTKFLKISSVLPISVIQALSDCKQLAELNVDMLLHTVGTLNSTKSSIDSLLAEDLRALLSAIETNQQTCLDGLQFTSSLSSWSAASLNKAITVAPSWYRVPLICPVVPKSQSSFYYFHFYKFYHDLLAMKGGVLRTTSAWLLGIGIEANTNPLQEPNEVFDSGDHKV